MRQTLKLLLSLLLLSSTPTAQIKAQDKDASPDTKYSACLDGMAVAFTASNAQLFTLEQSERLHTDEAIAYWLRGAVNFCREKTMSEGNSRVEAAWRERFLKHWREADIVARKIISDSIGNNKQASPQGKSR